jgi:hypothetical protein
VRSSSRRGSSRLAAEYISSCHVTQNQDQERKPQPQNLLRRRRAHLHPGTTPGFPRPTVSHPHLRRHIGQTTRIQRKPTRHCLRARSHQHHRHRRRRLHHPRMYSIIYQGDGIYDKLSNDEVIEVVWDTFRRDKGSFHTIHEFCGKAVENIMKLSFNKKTLDNVTVVMIAF